jgi:hypothetical protein
MAAEVNIRKVLAKLSKAFPSRQYSDAEFEELAVIWLEVLGDVPDEALLVAAKEYLLSDAKFAPAPGQLRTRAIELCGLDTSEMAERAWLESKEQIYSGEKISDPIAKIAWERAGGIAAWNNAPDSETHWWHDRFVKQYSLAFGKQTAGMSLPAGGDAAKLLENVAEKFRGGGQKRIESGMT